MAAENDQEDIEHELKTSLDGFVENSGGDHDQDPRYLRSPAAGEIRLPYLSCSKSIGAACAAQATDSLVRWQHDVFEASFKTLAAFDASMKGKAIEHGLCMACPCRGYVYR
jgi:hypothetical protein